MRPIPVRLFALQHGADIDLGQKDWRRMVVLNTSALKTKQNRRLAGVTRQPVFSLKIVKNGLRANRDKELLQTCPTVDYRRE